MQMKPPWSSLEGYLRLQHRLSPGKARPAGRGGAGKKRHRFGHHADGCWTECLRFVLLNSSPEPSPIAWSCLKTLSGRPAVRRDFNRWAA